MSLGYNTKRGIFGEDQAGGGIFNNAISGLAGLGCAPSRGTRGALGDYYNGGLTTAAAKAQAAAANANSYSAKVKSASDSSVGIPIFRTATQFVQSAQNYAAAAGNEFNSTNWQSGSDQASAASLVQAAQNAANSAVANLNAAGNALARLPKPPVPAAYLAAINSAKAQAANATSFAAKVKTFKYAKDAQTTMNAAGAACQASVAYVESAAAMYNATDFSKELSDEADWIRLGQDADAARNQGCTNVDSAAAYMNLLPGTAPAATVKPVLIKPVVPQVTPTYVAPSKPATSTASMLATGGIIAAIAGGGYFLAKKKGWLH